MKNLLIFLFGAAVGAAGTFIYFRKDIKEELKNAENTGSDAGSNGENSSENSSESGENVPFIVDENGQKTEKIVAAGSVVSGSGLGINPNYKAKIPYNTLFEGSESTSGGMFSDPRESGIFGQTRDDEDLEGGFIGHDETDGGVFEIDKDDFNADDGYEQERLVYYRGDRIMCTEDGTVVTNPFILVGGEWDKCVGNYADHTAFIRNARLVTDYEIFVEDGLYSDEYGPPDGYRED